MNRRYTTYALLFALIPSAVFGAEWNPGGENLYRLVRVEEPGANESQPDERIRVEIQELIDRLEAAPNERLPETRRLILSVERILTNVALRGLYYVFLKGLRDGALKYPKPAADAAAPSIPTNGGVRLKGEGAGLLHLELFEGFQNDARELLQGVSVSDPADYFHLFDVFLIEQGIAGFAAYAAKQQFTLGVYTRSDPVADFMRNAKLSFSGYIAAGICAVAVLAFTAGYMAQHAPPHKALEQEVLKKDHPATAPIDPQQQADQAARDWGNAVSGKLKSPGGRD